MTLSPSSAPSECITALITGSGDALLDPFIRPCCDRDERGEPEDGEEDIDYDMGVGVGEAFCAYELGYGGLVYQKWDGEPALDHRKFRQPRAFCNSTVEGERDGALQERTSAKKNFVLPSVEPGFVKMAMVMAQARKTMRPCIPWRTIFSFWRKFSENCMVSDGEPSALQLWRM